MYVDQTNNNKKMTSKVLRSPLLNETFTAGGSPVNLINEERGHAENKRKMRRPTRVKAMGRG